MNNNTKEVHLTVLSQAPFDSFGDIFGRGMEKSTSTLDKIEDELGIGAYKGDGKDVQFTPDSDASAKLKFTADIDLENKQLSHTHCRSPQGTTFLRTGEHAVAKPKYHGTLDPNNNTLTFDYAGANPIASGAPDIDVKGKLQFINEENGDLHIKGALRGDGFPATSAFVHFTKDDTHGVMLGSAPLEAGTSKNTGVFKLTGEGDTKIMDIDLSIKFDKNHVPTHVSNLVNDKTYSVEEWNTLHREKPMLTPSPEAFHCSTSEMVVDNHVTCEPAEDISHILSQGNHSSDKGFVIGGDYTKNIEDIHVKQTDLDESNTFDAHTKVHEVLDKANLNDFTESNSSYKGVEIGD